MAIVHVMPGDSAGGSLLKALRDAQRDETIIPFPDNLSYGPIGADDSNASGRWEWWRWEFLGSREDHARALRDFWHRVMTAEGNLVVWWGRSPPEWSFFLAFAAQLAERSYETIEVTGTQHEFVGRNGTRILSQPAEGVSTMRHEGLELLFDKQVLVSAGQRELAAAQWLHLCRENAPFRIVSDTGLVSAPIDVFDAFILERLSTDWRDLSAVLWDVYSRQHHYCRISSGMILMRLAAMVDDGRVLANQVPLNVKCSRIRLPGGG